MALRLLIPGLLAVLLAGTVAGVGPARAADGGDAVAAPLADAAVLVEIKDAISPATREFFLRTLAQAEKQKAALVVLVLDTPGGLSDSMRDMIQGILNAQIPVVIYVAPSGAHAASAGTFMLYASHVAAMAPGTNLGAATPVPIGGSVRRKEDKDEDKGKDGDSKKASGSTTAMDRKAMNDAVAYIRSLAELRGRNVECAEAAVARRRASRRPRP